MSYFTYFGIYLVFQFFIQVVSISNNCLMLTATVDMFFTSENAFETISLKASLVTLSRFLFCFRQVKS